MRVKWKRGGERDRERRRRKDGGTAHAHWSSDRGGKGDEGGEGGTSCKEWVLTIFGFSRTRDSPMAIFSGSFNEFSV